MKISNAILLAVGLSVFTACQQTETPADAYGNFEADDMIVSAEGTGELIAFQVEEGQTLKAGQVVGCVDSTQLVLKKEQIEASVRAIAAKSPAIAAQLSVFEKQLDAAKQQISTLQREQTRVQNLLKSDAATPKQLDDINAQLDQAQKQVAVILEQKTASNASLSVQKSGLLAEILPMKKQIAQIDDQITKCRVVNPINGTVLNTYASQGELAAFGKPLYKIANLDPIILRAYIAGDQLGSIKVGQNVTVSVDAPDGAMKDYTGTVTWISEKAEFTPKVIQTRDERVNLVYAVKIKVGNDGGLKIGMPGEVKISL
ncbi:MAG: efflux RND transporter periplasmic adaptor subunit [Lewinellaceae bacterium]|nr:efflux RND transporter periplasmic adaptor subunit [Lewinellaceae bacterium]